MRIVVIVAALLIVSACNSVPSIAIIDGASVVSTEKTLEDHAVSIYLGKNCSTVRVEQGLSYCVEDEVFPVPAVYCYRTLGEVTCYDKPDPHKGRHQRVGDNEHNLVRNKP
jgi:hypothetical protein